MRPLAILVTAGLMSIAACTSSAPESQPEPSSTRPDAVATPTAVEASEADQACSPSPVQGSEIAGTSSDGLSLFALMQGGPGALTSDGDEVHHGKSSKFVLRVTGAGDVKVIAKGPGGQIAHPDWGPEAHASSNFDRPGDEWGVGFTFPSVGCWTVAATRQGRSAHFGIGVV